ncbi:hypothetical protein DLJ51_03205 [Streptococcus sobrinus]|nr:hypothetical protein DLJ52_03205 [Streptococcus sobrinus]AWN63139.1 hypothetical protein DLJ51_03205 [Streptococcus sobrinus]
MSLKSADASKLLTRYRAVKRRKGLKRSGRPFLPELENRKVRQEIWRRSNRAPRQISLFPQWCRRVQFRSFIANFRAIVSKIPVIS